MTFRFRPVTAESIAELAVHPNAQDEFFGEISKESLVALLKAMGKQFEFASPEEQKELLSPLDSPTIYRQQSVKNRGAIAAELMTWSSPHLKQAPKLRLHIVNSPSCEMNLIKQAQTHPEQPYGVVLTSGAFRRLTEDQIAFVLGQALCAAAMDHAPEQANIRHVLPLGLSLIVGMPISMALGFSVSDVLIQVGLHCLHVIVYT